jgi:hypothetical protein
VHLVAFTIESHLAFRVYHVASRVEWLLLPSVQCRMTGQLETTEFKRIRTESWSILKYKPRIRLAGVTNLAATKVRIDDLGSKFSTHDFPRNKQKCYMLGCNVQSYISKT